MKLLLAGEDREGALLRSLEVGLRHEWQVTVVDPAGSVTRIIDDPSLVAKVRRRRRADEASACLVEAVEQNDPNVVLVIKGRGIDAAAVEQARRTCPVAIYYPDNPLWKMTDAGDALARLEAADLAIIWSQRLQTILSRSCRRVEMVPFGFDHRWFPVTDPAVPRSGIAFAGTWSLRRERLLGALVGLDLTIVGSGWERAPDLGGGAPRHGEGAGRLLRDAAIGVNMLHPHNAGAHNMRTREIMASGCAQLTDPGTDGTPLRDGAGCRWFRSPAHLRELAEHYLAQREEAIALAAAAQGRADGDTYVQRATEISAALKKLA